MCGCGGGWYLAPLSKVSSFVAPPGWVPVARRYITEMASLYTPGTVAQQPVLILN